MKDIKAVNNIILQVDLTGKNVQDLAISNEDRRNYLGGKGLGLKLLYDNIKVGIDPLSPQNIITFMSGPAVGTAAPAGGRFVVSGKSPLTGIFASSCAGGRFGYSLKRAGYDGIMITGKADSPVYIKIDKENVSIEDAKALWGMDTYELQDARKDEGDWVVIGPAGENLVLYASIVSGRRVAGRCGLGAVMGSKNVKGLVASGSRKVVPANPAKFSKALKTALKKIKSHEMTAVKLPDLGTPQNIMVYGTTGVTPVRNFKSTSFEQIEKISGEEIKDKHFVKNHGCVGCPIQCGRMGKYNGREVVSPEYETIALMGSNLEIDNISRIADWNEKLNRLGLDSISTGSSIAFAMELTEKGMFESGLAFGNPEGIGEKIEDIAYRRGTGNDMADGVKKLSEKYGGKDFAIHVKGLEMAAYDPRGCTGQGLGYATANCGATHLSGSTHAVEVGSYLSPHGTRGKAHMVKFMQDLTDVVNSAIFCIQTEYPFLEENFMYKNLPMPILRFLMRRLPAFTVGSTDLSDYCSLLSGIMGYKINRKELYKIGERIFNLERYMNCREGIGKKDDTLPDRILHEVREDGWPPVELRKMLNKYYKLRKWDESGQPGPEVLKKFGINVSGGQV